MKQLEWPDGLPMEGVAVGKSHSGDWDFQLTHPCKLKYSLQQEIAKFQNLPDVDDAETKEAVEVLTPGLADAVDLKFLAAAIAYVRAFMADEAEGLADLAEHQLAMLLAALVSIVINDTMLFVDALDWEQRGRPDISTTSGHSELRDACIIIFGALD